ncbi:serine/threonine-protein kinase bud32 [Tilletia horrida]|uniref:non-specific serine/threonine protein kinase n=1 Tax=Tilletia horrida TaxID=155126 RepID=A0AAN6GFV4_9BASI|nr:serine/threonine-protein kinase bud32 [Tilletia horrida]KAK0533888.1 serine/threonine-protein kinase bud32 [Tilletia horrida]KAK0539312.1 serine/threonine-protein kinase bud32 [Tilletia horrida]KAK0560368.1 serine/threonine-protein kinase bud32 [Tilletia horrida]
MATSPSALLSLLQDDTRSTLIKQGAEAKVYQSTLSAHASFSTSPLLLKWRFPKTYRHPTLSAALTAQRTAQEARGLMRCLRAGASVPAMLCVDELEGILGLEWIEGPSVREVLGGGAEGVLEDSLANAAVAEGQQDASATTSQLGHEDQLHLMRLIGSELARIHLAEVIHGDLTTSNMLLRSSRQRSRGSEACAALTDAAAVRSQVLAEPEHWEVVLIDFGLSSVSALAEDRAVDLYVLERAFASTHPASEGLYSEILKQYALELERTGKKEKGTKHSVWEEVRRRLEEVRLRGRKRSMVG